MRCSAQAPDAKKAASRAGEHIRKAVRKAYFPEAGAYVDCPIYDRYRLGAGTTITGPAIVEERESTTVLPPGVEATVDAYANLIVECGPCPPP